MGEFKFGLSPRELYGGATNYFQRRRPRFKMTISWFSKNIPHNSVTNGDNRELIAKNQRVSSHGVRARTVCVRVNRRDTSFLSLSFSLSPLVHTRFEV